jgi:hypothetical protein
VKSQIKSLRLLYLAIFLPVFTFNIPEAKAEPACGSGKNAYLLSVASPVGSRQFAVACTEHDACYDIFGKSKGECDKAFHNRMLGICAWDHNTWFGKGLKIACNGRADAFYSAVNRLGKSAYDKAKTASAPAPVPQMQKPSQPTATLPPQVSQVPSASSGKSLILHNRDSSQLAVWIMNGTTVSQGGEPQPLGQGWVPISSGDFNGDGKADVLLSNRDSSQLAVWIMNGTTVSQGGAAQPLGQGWVPISSGDFNGDGKADVLLSNRDSSQLAVWIMNGTTVSQGGAAQSLGQGWVPISSGDFNGDGKADVLLYNRDSSQLAVWIMNGTTVSQGGAAQSLGQGWVPISSGDFNRDGKADILLYNRDSSQLAVWIMNGTTVSQGGAAQPLGQGWVPINNP